MSFNEFNIERIKIINCLEISKYFPPIDGGIEKVVETLSKGLSERGWNIEILCSSIDHKTTYESKPIPILRVATLTTIASTPISPRMISCLVSKHSSQDVIHIHLPNPMSNLALCIARPKAKIVVFWHSDVVRQIFLMKIIYILLLIQKLKI